ncbi:hypothetical protein PBY51_000435 [Eleginops maclovinus]|uniref:Uncharacterized protein n=1 Tax=Eleginops maclovinus TaxID=56733 RepID=A0AAN7XJV2_ELEMC|nr:hypothetical protein PBY51_000435 [Eleginops maclovinus]
MRIKSAPPAKKKKKKKKKWAVAKKEQPQAAALGWEGAGGRKAHLAGNCAPLRQPTLLQQTVSFHDSISIRVN